MLVLLGWLAPLLLLVVVLCCSRAMISACCCPIFSANFEASAKLVVARVLVRDNTSCTSFFSCGCTQESQQQQHC